MTRRARGVALSPGEQDQLDRALGGSRKICEWLLKRVVAGEAASPNPAPSPAPAVR